MAWRTLSTVAHSLMVHARVSEVYIHFALMYTTDHIFPVLLIKDLINKDGDPTTPHKLATGTKPSVSHLRLLFCPCVVRKATSHVEIKALNMCHQAQKGFRGIVRQCILIGKVDNDIIELWLATSNTCKAAGRPSRQKVGTQCSTWKVETGIVPLNGSVGPLAG